VGCSRAARPGVLHELPHQPAFGGNRAALFFLYAALLGDARVEHFLIYTGASITRVFFISAATFGALSLYGYTTQRDLSRIGSFLFMGLIGIIIASLVNMFLPRAGSTGRSRSSAC
jgi:FtsH-binding integral membrane protein